VPARPLEAIAQGDRDMASGAKTCSRCGRQFGCRHGEPGCWCESVELRRETLAEIRALADDCLCPSCLGDFARRDRDEAASAGTAPAAAGQRQGTWAKAIPDASIRARGVPPLWGLSAALFLFCSLTAGLAIGPFGIGPGAIGGSALSHLPVLHVDGRLGPIDEAILWQVRAPRVVLAALVGGMLAIAGSAYQGVFRNPLADPYLLGVAAGAGLGATLAIAYAGVGTGQLLPLAAFVGAVVGVAGAYVLGRSAGGASSTGALILAGVAVAAFMTAAQTFLQQQNSEALREIYSWLLGGFTTADWHEVALVAPWVAVSSAVILAHRRSLDVLSVGDEEAANLGMNVRRVRLTIVTAATAGTAAAVAFSGLIGFVGIIVPHTIRLLVSSSYRAIVPLSLLVGAGFLVLTDILARTALSPAEVPIGVVTAFLGAPFFAVVLRKSRAVDL
jgi:iron complex transport system permease protein